MKLYVYCLVESGAELPHDIQGIGGAKVRLLSREKLSLLVSDFAGDAVPVSRENVLRHAAVMQRVLETTTPLPFRFRTLVTAEQVENYIKAKQAQLMSKLEQVRGCVEMSVKIISDSDRVEEPVDSTALVQPGTAFLFEKRREILGGEARVAEAKRVAEWLEHLLREVVKETSIQTTRANKMIVAAAHLIERDRIDDFKQTVTEARRKRPELHFLVSGPWAPYSFANIDLEFKTHFGVS